MPIQPAWIYSSPWADLTTAALPRPADFSIRSAGGDKIVSLIEGFFFFFVVSSSSSFLFCPSAVPPSPSLIVAPSAGRGVYLGAMGKGEANDSQWLLISTICWALGPLIPERKSNTWRESDRHKLGPANRPIVCSKICIQARGALQLAPGGEEKRKTCARATITAANLRRDEE